MPRDSGRFGRKGHRYSKAGKCDAKLDLSKHSGEVLQKRMATIRSKLEHIRRLVGGYSRKQEMIFDLAREPLQRQSGQDRQSLPVCDGQRSSR